MIQLIELSLLAFLSICLCAAASGRAADTSRPAQPAGAGAKRPLVLLMSRFAHGEKDLAAATLAWMCKERGVEFDAYYAAEREGGIFSVHGSMMVGGRHGTALSQALLRFDATVVRLGETNAFAPLAEAGAKRTIDANAGLVDLYERAAKLLGASIPSVAVAMQTQGLPKGLDCGVAQYAFPEVVYRKALALPLELDAGQIARLKELGVKEVFTVATASADASKWSAAGLKVSKAEELADGDGYESFTLRLVKRWIKDADGIDYCEPVLASYWLPFCVRENRVQGAGLALKDAIPALVKDKKQSVVYGRYSGGAKGVNVGGDKGLFILAENNIAFQVLEPGRPALSVLSRAPRALPQPAKSGFDLEPSDRQLEDWAGQGKILTTYVLHSGELSHEDAVIQFVDYSAATKVKIGMGAHWQRYLMDPECVEPLHVPVSEGGAMGLVEPVLHSAGSGIIAESLAEPNRVAAMMKDARAKIAAVAGDRFAPRGVYCYLDATPRKWDDKPLSLWKAIKDAGFEYVLSSVSHGDNKVLHRDGDFVVLNMCGGNMFPNSPFIRVKAFSEMEPVVKKLTEAGKPGWIVAVLDSPLYGYPPYLSTGHKWGGGVKLGDLYRFVTDGEKSGKLVSATPRTIARYARLLQDKGLLPK